MLKNSPCTYRCDYALTSPVADRAEKQVAQSKREAGTGVTVYFCPPFIQKSTQTMKAACRGAARPGKAAGVGSGPGSASHRPFSCGPFRYSPKSPALQSETVHYKRGVSQQFSLPSFKIDFSEWKDDEVTSLPAGPRIPALGGGPVQWPVAQIPQWSVSVSCGCLPGSGPRRVPGPWSTVGLGVGGTGRLWR